MMQKGLKKYFLNMDEYLASLGLYRKMVARDASSLFRAVSEQLYFSQNYHQKIRQDCADYMRTNQTCFEPFVEGSFEKYLQRLEDPKETVGQVEIKALSQLYRRCFLIYRYPGKPATVISEEDYIDKVTLCCSINGHYDIVYPRTYPVSAAFCQSLVYEVLYLGVFGVDESDLVQALEQIRVGGRRFRNSLSVCSDLDYDREEAEPAVTSEEKPRPVTDEAPPPSRPLLPYKVLKSLDGDVYRNVEFDVWQDSCKEMQKTEYMVFAGRQYFLGDKCQVRLEPKGKYYNAFIQEVGTHSSAVTVFIEELGEKHLVPLTDLKPVNPVPAWNVAPTRKDLDPDSRGQRHRQRFFRKCRGKGSELVLGPLPFPGQNQLLPPRFQSSTRPPPPPSPGALTYDPYAPPPSHHHHHHHAARGQSSTRFLNRHMIGPQLTYYHPGRRYYHDYDNYAFRSRRSRRQLSKDGTFGFSDAVDNSDLYYQLDPIAGQAPPPAAGSGYRPSQAPPTHQTPPSNSSPVSSEDEPESHTNQGQFTEDFIYSSQDQSFQSTVVYNEPTSNQDEQEVGSADSPPRPDLNYNFTQQVKPMVVLGSSPSSSSASSGSSPASAHPPPRPVPVPVPATAPWLVNELGEPVCTVVAPPPYSCDPNCSDLPRDCRVVQYYFNLGIQWYHQSFWQQQQTYSAPDQAYYQHYTPHAPTYIPSEPLHVPPQSFTEPRVHQPSVPYQDCTRTEGQTDEHQPAVPGSSLDLPSPAPVYPDPPAPVLHVTYEAPPPHLHHSPFYTCHWPQPAPRVYCPGPGPSHVVSYIPNPHYSAGV